MDDARKVLESALFVVLGIVGGMLLRYIGRVVLARGLAPERYGQYVQSLAVMELAAVVGVIGISFALPRMIGFYRDRVDWEVIAGSGLLLAVPGLLVLAAVVWALAPVLAGLFGGSSMVAVLRVVAVGVVPFGLYRVCLSVLRGLEDARSRVAIEDGLVPVLLIIVPGALLLSGYGTVPVVAGIVAVFGIGALAAFLAVIRVGGGSVSRFSFRPWLVLGFAPPLLVVSVFLVVNRWVDVVMVGYFMSPASTGAYELALALAGLVGAFNTAIAYRFLPRASSLIAAGDIADLSVLYRRITRWSMVVTLPVAGSLVVAPGFLLSVLFGPSYAVAGAAMMVLSLSYCFMAVAGPTDTLLLADGARYRLMLAVVALGVVDAAGNWLLIPRYGLTGAAAGMAAGILVSTVLGAAFAWQRRRVHPFTRRYAGVVLAGIVVYGGLFMVRGAVTGWSWPVVLALAGLVYLGLVWLVDGLDGEDLGAVRGLMDRG